MSRSRLFFQGEETVCAVCERGGGNSFVHKQADEHERDAAAGLQSFQVLKLNVLPEKELSEVKRAEKKSKSQLFSHAHANI